MGLFSGSKAPVRILEGGVFGPQLTLDEVQAAFNRGLENPAIRAIGQMCLAMRETAIGDSASALADDKAMQGALHSGEGNACAELATIIAGLSNGKMGDTVKAWFADQSK